MQTKTLLQSTEWIIKRKPKCIWSLNGFYSVYIRTVHAAVHSFFVSPKISTLFLGYLNAFVFICWQSFLVLFIMEIKLNKQCIKSVEIGWNRLCGVDAASWNKHFGKSRKRELMISVHDAQYIAMGIEFPYTCYPYDELSEPKKKWQQLEAIYQCSFSCFD